MCTRCKAVSQASLKLRYQEHAFVLNGCLTRAHVLIMCALYNLQACHHFSLYGAKGTLHFVLVVHSNMQYHAYDYDLQSARAPEF